MKKLLSYFLALCMLISVLALFAVNTEATYGYLLGDADDSLQINMKDILLTRRYVAGLTTEKDINLTAADADKNTTVNLKDVLLIRKHVAGTEFLEGVNEKGTFKVGTVSIGERNITRFTIVIPDDATECMENAAQVLKNKISAACGYTLSVTYGETSTNGYKIRFSFDENGENALGLEGYRVYVGENGDLNIICGSLRGPIYATYYILEEFIGYRYFPGITDFLYSSDSVNISSTLDEKEIPGYSYRAGVGGTHPIERRMNDTKDAQKAEVGWRVGSLFIHAHSYAYQMAGYDKIYTDGYLPYEKTQPCLMDEETYEKIVDYNLKLLNERETGGQHLGEGYTQISCSPNDNTDFCKCINCKRIYEIEGSIGGTVFRLSNRVIEAMQEVYPEIELYTIAYWDARNPPKFTRPHDDVCVGFCIQGCNNHSYDKEYECVECEGNQRLQSPSGANCSNAEDMSFCRQWAELTNNLQIWYYSANFRFNIAPSPNIMNVYNDFKYLADIGATGMYCEGSGMGNSFETLRGYLAGKMMWDPYMSEEEFNNHINEFLAAYYGEGWKNIREYLNMQTEAGDLNGCWTNNFDRPWNMYNEEYFAENYLYMTELFDKALAETSGAEQKNHIRLLRVHVDFLGLSATYDRDWVNGDSGAKALYAEHFKWLYNFVNSSGYKLSDLDNVNYPKAEDDIIKPMSWFGDDFTGYWIWVEKEHRWI